MRLDQASLSRPREGEILCGDRVCVCEAGGGWVAAVADGLGHGLGAAEAAEAAMRSIQAHAGDPVTVLFQHCHEVLKGTRGAALSIASLQPLPGGAACSLEWAAVGNVEGLRLLANPGRGADRVHLFQMGGVVGRKLPRLRPDQSTLEPGDCLVFATDGIQSGFVVAPGWRLKSVTELAEDILAQASAMADDALTWVGRLEA